MMKVEKPVLNGKTDAENIQILETWASNLTDLINYEINHLDERNFVPGVLPEMKLLEQKIDRNYQELRELIINRTKGG